MKTRRTLSKYNRLKMNRGWNWLISISGEDLRVIARCNIGVKVKVSGISLSLILVFLLSFYSSFIAFDELFRFPLLGLIIPLFFSAMITNIYLLILQTFNRSYYPTKNSFSNKKFPILFPLGIKVLFICLISLIISKPLETDLFQKVLDQELIVFKKETIKKYKSSTEKYFNEEIENLSFIIEKQKINYKNPETSQIDKYEQLIVQKKLEKRGSISAMIQLVNGCNFFFQRLIFLHTKIPYSWLVTLGIITIFFIPIWLKQSLHKNSTYKEESKNREQSLIVGEYQTFKKVYTEIFKNKFGVTLEYSESYQDPPFNTLRKVDSTVYHSTEDLIRDLSNG